MDSRIDTTNFSFTTKFTPVYLAKNLKIIKCVNLPLLIDFDIKKIIKGQFDTSFLVIVADSVYYSSEYDDKDVCNSLKELLRRKDSQAEANFIKLFSYPFLDLKSGNKIVYNDDDDSQITEKITATLYRISTKSHNDYANYFLDCNNGLLKSFTIGNA